MATQSKKSLLFWKEVDLACPSVPNATFDIAEPRAIDWRDDSPLCAAILVAVKQHGFSYELIETIVLDSNL